MGSPAPGALSPFGSGWGWVVGCAGVRCVPVRLSRPPAALPLAPSAGRDAGMGRICVRSLAHASTPSSPLAWPLFLSRGLLPVFGGWWCSTQWKSVPLLPPLAPFVADLAGPGADTDSMRVGMPVRASMLSGIAPVPVVAPPALAARLRPAAVVVAAPPPRVLPGLSSPCRCSSSILRAPGSVRTLRPPSS